MPRSELRRWWLEPNRAEGWVLRNAGTEMRRRMRTEVPEDRAIVALWRLVQWQRMRLERADRSMREGVIEHLEIGNGRMEATIRNKAVTQAIARALVGMLRDSNGGAMPENFATSTIEVGDPDPASFERFSMTIQRVAPGKLTPQEKLDKQAGLLLDADAAVLDARVREDDAWVAFGRLEDACHAVAAGLEARGDDELDEDPCEGCACHGCCKVGSPTMCDGPHDTCDAHFDDCPDQPSAPAPESPAATAEAAPTPPKTPDDDLPF